MKIVRFRYAITGAVLLMVGTTLADAEISGWGGLPEWDWHSPKGDLRGTEPEVSVYGATGFFVDRSGLYTLSAHWLYESVPTGLFLYAGSFDPLKPLASLVAGIPPGRGGKLRVGLARSTVYYLVTSIDSAHGHSFLPFVQQVVGPGRTRLAESSLPDEVDSSSPRSYADSRALQDGRFGVGVTADSGDASQAVDAVFQTNDTASFRFLNGTDGELEVRVLNRCGLNGFFWVYITRATNRAYQIDIKDFDDYQTKHYELPVGLLDATVIDRGAFPCPVSVP